MENDEQKTPEETPETEPSTVEETPPEGSEADKTPEEEAVPYSRFKEIIEEKNSLKDDLTTLKEDIATLKQGQKPEVEEEPLDWKEAEKRTVDKAVAKIKGELETKAEQDQAQDRAIENSFTQLKTMGQEITPTVKKAVLTEMIKSGNEDVFATYLKIKEQSVKDTKVEEIKEKGFIPPSQKGSGAGTGGLSYDQLKAMSMDEIVERAADKPK